jgi:RNA polymerase sigma-70 factor, ECF subfamily
LARRWTIDRSRARCHHHPVSHESTRGTGVVSHGPRATEESGGAKADADRDVERSRATDPLRFEDLFLAERQRLFGALCLITRDEAEAEDIGQEAFVRVFERWDRVASMSDPVGYLFRVAMNVFRSRYRRTRFAMRRLLVAGAPDMMSEIEERDSVVRMLRLLNPKQRAAIVLTAMLDYSSDEAGQILGMSGSSVRVLTTRARALLRSMALEDQ